MHDFLGWAKISPLMYFWMTRELFKITSKVLIVQEGGYNLEYLGYHASGVVEAILHHDEPDYEPEPTQVDKDVGISSLKDIDDQEC